MQPMARWRNRRRRRTDGRRRASCRSRRRSWSASRAMSRRTSQGSRSFKIRPSPHHIEGPTMRLLTYAPPGGGSARVGARLGERVLDLAAAAKIATRHVPSTMKSLLHAGDIGMGGVREVVKLAEADAKK